MTTWAERFNEVGTLIGCLETSVLVHRVTGGTGWLTSATARTSKTFTYAPEGLKRTEDDGTTMTTLVWDGDDYLMERS